MFLFFRKIRKGSLQESRLSKYFTYAFGEIILVVVGILIALQIDNWNEERTDKEKIKAYLTTIINDVSLDIEELKRDKEIRDNMRSDNQVAAQMYITEDYDIPKLMKASRFFFEFYFIPNGSGYQALVSSGLMGRIANTPIESELNQYYVSLDAIHEAEVSFNTFIERVESNFRQNYPSIKYGLITRSAWGHENFNYLPEEMEEALSKRTDELLEYFLTNEFQAGVLRTASQGTGRYGRTIEQGEKLIETLKAYIEG